MSNEIEPFVTAELIDNLPDPRDLTRVVKERIESATQQFRAERGDVHLPEDTFDLHRRLQATAEKCADYARGFTAAGKLIRELQREELEAAVGEQDGVPLSGLTVPTAGGDIRIAPDFRNEHTIDPELVQAAIAAKLSTEYGPDSEMHTFLCQVARDAMTALCAAGKWEPQVSKVRAVAGQWSRGGDDTAASSLASAVRTKRTFQERVTVERKEPKR